MVRIYDIQTTYQRPMGEANEFDGRLVIREMDSTNVYVVVEDTEEEKIAIMTNKNEPKGKMLMDPMIETLWPLEEYSNPMEETILGWQTPGNVVTTSGASAA